MSTTSIGSLKNYIPELDGVRGLAIILVVGFHYFFNIFPFGWIGVDLFFVLSGYLITSRLISTEKREDRFSIFYKNRILRILPIYYAAFFSFFVGYHLLVSSKNLPFFSFYDKNWLSFVMFFQNWSFIEYGQVKENHLQHFWSLAIEEQFYLIWPLLIFKFRRNIYFFKAILFVLLSIIALRTFLFIKYPDPIYSVHYYYNTFCRMDSFLLGGVLFLYQQKNKAKQFVNYFFTATLILILGIIITGNAKISNPFISTIGFTLIALMFTGLIHNVTTHSTKIISHVFNYSWLKFVGKISYGLYIFHWIVLRVLEPKLSQQVSEYIGLSHENSHWFSLFGCLAISFLLSVISFFYFESYFLKLKRR
jgi:peptidoglycan/LPS O-acetylase OafA/YrhL